MSHPSVNLSLQDKQGLTPFAVAMVTKNNRAADEILARESSAAEQVRWWANVGVALAGLYSIV